MRNGTIVRGIGHHWYRPCSWWLVDGHLSRRVRDWPSGVMHDPVHDGVGVGAVVGNVERVDHSVLQYAVTYGYRGALQPLIVKYVHPSTQSSWYHR